MQSLPTYTSTTSTDLTQQPSTTPTKTTRKKLCLPVDDFEKKGIFFVPKKYPNHRNLDQQEYPRRWAPKKISSKWSEMGHLFEWSKMNG